MKSIKYFIVSLILFVLASPVFADVLPYYTSSLDKHTMGFVQVPQSFNLYLYPREDSQIIETVRWNHFEVKLKNATVEPSTMFVALVEHNKFAFCSVIDEQEGWYKIIYDKSENKSGWIKLKSEDDFWGLKDFYSFYGMKYGMYYMKDIDYRKRGIYSSPMDAAQKLGGFTLIQDIKLNKLSGNWALVTVVDFDSKPKIGYIRWREDDGTIVIFPKIGS